MSVTESQWNPASIYARNLRSEAWYSKLNHVRENLRQNLRQKNRETQDASRKRIDLNSSYRQSSADGIVEMDIYSATHSIYNKKTILTLTRTGELDYQEKHFHTKLNHVWLG